MKLCTDCKHGPDFVSGTRCHNPTRSNLTDGTPKHLCVLEREDGFIGSLILGSCGKAGRFWEAKA